MDISSWPGSRVLGALDALMDACAFAQRNMTNTIMYSLGQKLKNKGTLTITQIDTARSKLPLYAHVLKDLRIRDIEVQVPGHGNTKYSFMLHNPKTFRVYFPLESPIVEQVNRLTGVEWRDQGYHVCEATKRNAHVLMNSGFVPDDRVLAFMSRPETYPLYEIEGLLLKPEPYQIEGISFFLDRDGRAILGDEMGLGKAQPLSAPLITPDGVVKMGEIKLGDLVFSCNGEAYPVTGVFPQGKKKVYQVEFSDGSMTQCCDDHLWYINTPTRLWRDQPWLPLPLFAFRESLYFKNGDCRYHIPIAAPLRYTPKEQQIDPYVMGVYLADGDSRHSVRIHNSETSIRDAIQKKLPEGIYLNPLDGCSCLVTTGTRGASNAVLDALRFYGLCYKTAHQKFIPDAYKFGSVEQRLSLLQGLMDGDGECSSPYFAAYTTASTELYQDIKFLVESLGGVLVRPRQKERKIGGQSYGLYWHFGVKVPPTFSLFLHSKKAEKYAPSGKYGPARLIRAVTCIGEEECQCISVASPDRTYLTESCIVTHNTGQAIAYAWGANLRLVVAVVPASLKLNWAREITKWTGETSIFVAEGKKPTEDDKVAARQAKWIVINYDILQGWREFLGKLKPSCLLFDEVQAIKNGQSKRTLASKYVAKRSERVIALSGTPLENSPAELLPVIQMVDPALFPFPVQYEDRFCNLNQKTVKVRGGGTRDVKDASGATNTKELHRILTDTIFLRRKKAEVLPQLPDKRRAVIPVRMSVQAMREYKKVESDFLGWLKGVDPKKVVKAKKAEALMQFQTLKRLAARGKMGMVADWINTYLEAEPKLVVFAHHKDIIEKLKSIYSKSCVVVDGSVPANKRLELRDRFQEDPAIKLFIGNIKAAGTGLTLTAANATLTVELVWTSTAHDQCEDRVHRIGQKRGVTSYYVLAEGTVETRIINLLDRKRGIVSQVLDGEDPVDDDMLNELLLSYYEDL